MRAISSITPPLLVSSPQPNTVFCTTSIPNPPVPCAPSKTWSAWAFQTTQVATTWLRDSQDDITAASAILATVGALQWAQGNTGYGSAALCASAGLLAGRYCVRSAHELLASVRQTSHQVLHDDIPHSIDHAQCAAQATTQRAVDALQTASCQVTATAATVGHEMAEAADHAAREFTASASAVSHEMAKSAHQTARELAATVTLSSHDVAAAARQTTHEIIATVGRDVAAASRELAASIALVARDVRSQATRAAGWGAAGVVVLRYGPSAAALISWEALAVLLAGVPGMLAAAVVALTGLVCWKWRFQRPVCRMFSPQV